MNKASTESIHNHQTNHNQVNKSSTSIKLEEPIQTRNRLNAIPFFLFQLACLIAYGISGAFYVQTTASIPQASYIQNLSLIIMLLFVIVAFGLLLSIYRFGTLLGVTTAIVVVAMSVQLGPLLHKFWFSAFLDGFRTINFPSDVGSTVQEFWLRMSSTKVELNPVILRVTLLSCISILTCQTSIIGRISIIQLFKIVVIYQLTWNINYFLLIYLCVIKNDHNQSAALTPFFFDQFGSTYVYLFGTAFGMVLTFMLKSQKLEYSHARNECNHFSLVICATGTAFLFSCFIFTYSNSLIYTSFGENLTKFNIFWALISGVAGAYVGSAVFGKGEVGIKEALVGTISGGVIIGSCAAVVHNIGIVMAIGGVAGLFSGIYYRFLNKKVNNFYVHDAMGMFGTFAISSFLGSFVVTPLVLVWYSNTGEVSTATGYIIPYNLIGWQLIYVAISIGIGAMGGIFGGLLCICDDEYFGIASNLRFFASSFGLFDEHQLVLGSHNQNDNAPYPANSQKNLITTDKMTQGANSGIKNQNQAHSQVSIKII